MNKNILSLILISLLALLLFACNHEETKTTENDTDQTDTSTPTAGEGDTSYGKNSLNSNSPLAINIAPLNAWTPGWVFMDIMPKAQNWVSSLCDTGGFGDGPGLTLDSKGWVSSLGTNECADTSVMASQAQHYPEGTYVLLWEGEGSLSMTWDVDPPVTHNQGDSAEQTSDGLNRMTFNVEKANQSDLGIGIRISAVGTNHIKNVRLIMPGGMCGKSQTQLNYFQYCASSRGGEGLCASDETCYDFEDIYWDRFTDSVTDMNSPKPVFHPLYASTYQKYRSIRFMKWTRAVSDHYRPSIFFQHVL